MGNPPSPLKSWSTFLDSPVSSMSQPPPALNMTTRGIQKTSGLFDTGFTGVSSASVTSVKRDLDTPEIGPLSAADIFNSLEKGTDPSVPLEDSAGGDLPILGNLDLGLDDTPFLENFTDLSEFLFSGGQMDLLTPQPELLMPELPELPKPIVTSNEGGRAIKRTASTAVEELYHPPLNTDHDGYVSKIKKPRLSSVAESDTDSLASSTADLKEQKYLERRKKNNIASRRSRETRKQKFVSMEKQAQDLEVANVKLREQVEEMEKLTKLMKDILVKRMSGK